MNEHKWLMCEVKVESPGYCLSSVLDRNNSYSDFTSLPVEFRISQGLFCPINQRVKTKEKVLCIIFFSASVYHFFFFLLHYFTCLSNG